MGNLEFRTGLATGVTPQGQCTEPDSNTCADGELYTNQWGYSRGILGTRKQANTASDNTADQSANHVMANFSWLHHSARRQHLQSRYRHYPSKWLCNGRKQNRRANKVTSTCLKDPDLLTAPSISAYTDANNKTQRATVQFAIIDQNNYFDEDQNAPANVTKVMQNAHGAPIVPHVPVEIEVCINEKEQSKHFHPDEQIPNIVSLFEQSSDAKPWRASTSSPRVNGQRGTVDHRYHAAGGGASNNYRFEGTVDGQRTVCLRFDAKDFDKHGLTNTNTADPRTVFGCKATDAAVEAMAPYDFAETEKLNENGDVDGFNPAWTLEARNAYWGTSNKTRFTPRVYGSSSSYELKGTPMKVYPYNSLHKTPIEVNSTCSKKLEIELDSSLQGSLVVDIRAVQRQPRSTFGGATEDRVFYSSSQTMINFAPYHTGVKPINSPHWPYHFGHQGHASSTIII